GGPEPVPDAGTDASSSQPDAMNSNPPGGNNANASGGCGCTVAEPSRSPCAELLVLVVGLVPLIRRRRSLSARGKQRQEPDGAYWSTAASARDGLLPR